MKGFGARSLGFVLGASQPKVPDPQPAYLRLVQGVGLRVSVVGTRGRATLAGLAAAALRRRDLTVHCNVPRVAAETSAASAVQRAAAATGFAFGERLDLDAVRADVQRNSAVAALVLANPARSPTGLRGFHAAICLPHYVLLTNVRRDASGLLPTSLPRAARAIVQSVTPGATLISGETDAPLRLALRRECERAHIPFVDAAPRRAEFPGAEAVTVLDAFLRHRFGTGLAEDEAEAIRRELQNHFRWSQSSLPGVRWFNAGAIHDPDSTHLAVSYLLSQRRSPVTYVAYFRADRPGRARAFVPFLQSALAQPDTRQVILCGHHAQSVADRLRPWASQVRVVPDDVDEVPRLLRRLQVECQGGSIITLASAAPAWPTELAKGLQRPAPAHAPRPARPDAWASNVPRRIARPRVAAAAMPSADLEPEELLEPMPMPAPTPPPVPLAPMAPMAPMARSSGAKPDSGRPSPA